MIPCMISLKGGTASANVSLASVFFLEKFSLASDTNFFHIKIFLRPGTPRPFLLYKREQKMSNFLNILYPSVLFSLEDSRQASIRGG